MSHYTEGRLYSHISKSWIFEADWNDQEELARLRVRVADLTDGRREDWPWVQINNNGAQIYHTYRSPLDQMPQGRYYWVPDKSDGV